jgi:hypothetical protein
MAKTEAQAVAADANAADFHVTLDEFCARLSGTDRRVELIGAFFKGEQAAGSNKDAEAAYSARFVAFCNQPA